MKNSFDPEIASYKATLFLKVASQFQLGELPTEMSHPRTRNLSRLAQRDLLEAISLLKDIELEALNSIDARKSELDQLSSEIRQTLKAGGRIFFCGCGATGRLSLTLETLWREEYPAQANRVLSFIAGGDYALVRSIENFEDHPEYGARQLNDLGFGENDLLIAATEGGETPFVIGATEAAAQISRRAPWFLFCNPKHILIKKVERSKRVLENPRITSVSFETGPMAVAGSTRLQASTVLMLVGGAALFSAGLPEAQKSPWQFVGDFKQSLSQTPLEKLKPLIEAEADIYQKGQFCLHETKTYGITVLTDTTERSPTFSLIPFENRFDPIKTFSWTYLNVTGTQTPREAWNEILKRKPRPLDWPEMKDQFGEKILDGFDFDLSGRMRRLSERGENATKVFLIEATDDQSPNQIIFSFSGLTVKFPRPIHRLINHLLVKCALNINSTLVMGRLGRFSGNRMVYVKATNNKLIDRSIRCANQLRVERGLMPLPYETVARALFEVLETNPIDEPAVLKTLDLLAARELSRKSHVSA